MLNKKIALVGAGTVGLSFLDLFREKRPLIKKNFGINLSLVKVCDKRNELKNKVIKKGFRFVNRLSAVIEDPDIDIIIELIGGLNPAEDLIIRGLRNKKDIVTANKALLANTGKKLIQEAHNCEKNIFFEAAVAGAIPIIAPLREHIYFANVKEVFAILNGTANYVLYSMDQYQKSFEQALTEAQKKGFAERNPSLDIKGVDSLHKTAILCFLCFGQFPDLTKHFSDGIDKILFQDICYARELGFKIKLLSVLKEQGRGIEFRVHPALIPVNHPLAKVEKEINAIYINTEKSGNFLFSGLGAGGRPTSVSVLSDVIRACLKTANLFVLRQKDNKHFFQKKENSYSRYYLRFFALDKPGVLANISRVLSGYNISIASVTQKGRSTAFRKKFVPIIMVTHKAKEKHIYKAVARIDTLDVIKPSTQIIRIEDL